MRWRAGLAWALGALTAILALVGVVMAWSARGAALPPGMDAPPGVFFFLSWLTFAGTGVLVSLRRPANAVGWTLLGIGLSWEAHGLAGLHRTVAVTGQLELPAAAWTAWLWDWTYLPGVALVMVLLLVFPDGKLPSRRWWPIAGGLALAVVAYLPAVALRPGPLPSTPSVDNPIGVEGITSVLQVLEGIGTAAFVGVGLAALAAPIVRHRRAGDIERQQLRWFLSAAAIVVIAWIGANVLEAMGASAAVAADVRLLPLLLLPPAVGIAVLGHRLYDIDLVISKSLVYGTLAVLITGVYLAVVVGVGSLVGAREQVAMPLSILATAITAAAFAPVRARLQRAVNRLVFGHRASPYEVLASFAPRVTTAPRNGGLTEMARTVAEAVGATAGEVWLRVGEELHRAARWPEGAGPASSVDHLPVEHGAVRGGPDDARAPLALPGLPCVYPVRHDGRLLGALAVVPEDGRGLTSEEDQLLVDLAAVAWLVLENAELIDELRASRQRLVAAQDAARERIERDLHDGAQQRLLELGLSLQLARTAAVEQGAAGAAQRVEAAQDILRTASAELRDLARGIHPAILSTQGLVEAVRSLAERAPVAVQVRADGVDRVPPPVEATAYFVAAEALTNVIKHAGQAEACVEIDRVGGCLRIAVTDDGVGGADPRSPGLSLLADRVASLGGRLTVSDRAGGGTRVDAELPCG